MTAGPDQHPTLPTTGLSRRGFLGGALALGVISPLLAACGSSDAGTRAAGATRGGGGGRNSTTIRLGWSASLLSGAAKRRGVFAKTLAKQGIDVTWIGPFPNHAPSIQAVIGNSADLSFGGSSTVALAAIEAGGDLKVVSLSSTNIRTSSVLVLPKSGIDSVADMVGKKIAVNKSGLGQFIATAALQKANIPLDKVSFVYLDPGDAGPAFYSGKVDAWSIFGDTVQVAEAKYGAKAIFTDSKELSSQLDYTTVVTRSDYAVKHGDVLKAVFAAYQTEQQWLNAHFLDSVAANAKIEKLDATTVSLIKAQEKGTVTTLSAPLTSADVAKLQASADFMVKNKVLPKSIDVSKYALTRFA